jgi:hypothetical protein
MLYMVQYFLSYGLHDESVLLQLLRTGLVQLGSPSTCILSSRSPWLEEEAAVDCGERVAIGGNAMAVDALLTWVPTPIYRA